MVGWRRRFARVAGLLVLVGVLAYGTVAVLDLFGLRGPWRLFAYFLLTTGVVAAMFVWVAWTVLDDEG